MQVCCRLEFPRRVTWLAFRLLFFCHLANMHCSVRLVLALPKFVSYIRLDACICSFFVVAEGIFTSRIPSGIFVDWWRSQSRGRAPTLLLPCEVCILSKMSQSQQSQLARTGAKRKRHFENHILRVGRKAIFVLQPKA